MTRRIDGIELEQFRRQDPGTALLGIECEGAPELETRVREDSGAGTAVMLQLRLQMLVRDSSGTAWRLRGVGGFEPDATSFELESTECVDR